MKYLEALQIIKDMFFEELGILIPTELYFIDDIEVFELIVDGFKNNSKIVLWQVQMSYNLKKARIIFP